MIVKTVAVTYGRKLNLGDYSSAHVECTLWADLDEGDAEDLVMTGLWDMAKANVKAQLAPLTPEISAQAETAFLGIPITEGSNNGN